MNTKAVPLEIAAFNAHHGNKIRHGFFTRQGGVSKGIYSSLNVGQGSHDQPEFIAQNRQRVAQNLNIDTNHLISCYQTHSTDVITINKPFCNEKPAGDAMVTNVKGLALGILTADCGPLLFADKKAAVIGAAHAGWRGALYGIIDNTIAAMEALGSKRENIEVAIGPCIGPNHYEVGEEFLQNFMDVTKDNMQYFQASSQKNHFFFNLWQFLVDRLQYNEVKSHPINLCTYANEERFFSYRRKTHRGESDYGRQISTIIMGE